jgi:5-(carboxyamino)imidazole ribonucleotide synthase
LIAKYDDLPAGQSFFGAISAITFETEKLPVELFQAAAKMVPVRPGIPFLEMSQNRIREKTGLQRAGLPVGPFHITRSLADLEIGVAKLGTPAILKTASGGYDGKGQIRIEAGADLRSVWQSLATDEAILEAFVPFVDEISVVAARDVAGHCVTYGPIHNTHSHHILDVSYCPVELSPDVRARAIDVTTKIAESFAVVGVFCVELFVLADGQVWVNEIAPRPHNSGHLTIEGHVTSQFEQQVRCLCGLTVGSAELLQPVAMANLLGDRWRGGEPDWQRLASEFPEVQWHLYGKTEARVGRKMGHLTVTENSAAAAVAKVVAARTALTR